MIYLFTGFLACAPRLRNAIADYSNVNENFRISFISFLPPPHLLFPPLNPSFLLFLIAASPIQKDPITEAIAKALEDAGNKKCTISYLAE